MIEKYYKNISAPVGTPGIRAPPNPRTPPPALRSPSRRRWDDVLARSRTLGRRELYGGVRYDVYIPETMICENDMYPTITWRRSPKLRIVLITDFASTPRTSFYNPCQVEIKSDPLTSWLVTRVFNVSTLNTIIAHRSNSFNNIY